MRASVAIARRVFVFFWVPCARTVHVAKVYAGSSDFCGFLVYDFPSFILCFHMERTSFNPVIKYGEGKPDSFNDLLTFDWDDAFNMYGCLG